MISIQFHYDFHLINSIRLERKCRMKAAIACIRKPGNLKFMIDLKIRWFLLM